MIIYYIAITEDHPFRLIEKVIKEFIFVPKDSDPDTTEKKNDENDENDENQKEEKKENKEKKSKKKKRQGERTRR